MEVKFQVLDCDYINVGNKPVVRILGKTKKGKSTCAFHEGAFPYFYIQPSAGKTREFTEFLKKNFSTLVTDTLPVEKFLPVGYQSKGKNLIKIVLNDPSKVPIVRDELLRQPFVDGIFEADILFKYRFMADHNISGLGWVKVSGNPVSTSTVKSERTLKIESIEPIVEDTNAPLKYLSLDIETMSSKEGLPDSRRDPIIMISLVFNPTYNGFESLVLVAKKTTALTNGVIALENEKEMLEKFMEIVDKFDPDIILGYNINGFDFPYIIDRLRACKLPQTMGRCKRKNATWRKFGMRVRNRVMGRVIVDVFELVKESVGKGLLRLKRYGLGDVSKKLLDEDKLDIVHSEIGKYWNGNADQIGKLIEYSRRDSELAMKLLFERNMLDKFLELSKVSGLLLQDVLNSGEAMRIENLLLREFNKLEFVLPNAPSEEEMGRRRHERETKMLKGALVLEPETGLHADSVIYLDFKSMYPSIFISYNICPTTLVLPTSSKKPPNIHKTPYGTEFVSKKTRVGLIPKIVQELIKERDIVKNEMVAAKDDEVRRQLDAKQHALKIMANAFYGYTGYIRAKLYVLDIANTITSCGRTLIKKTKEIVESDPKFKVVYGDTDSVMVKTKTKDIDEAFKLGEKLEKKINKELAGVVRMKIENVFNTLVILTKKRYAGLSYEKIGGEWRENMVMKGIETVRRDWCDLVSETLYRVLEIILKDQNPKEALAHVRGVLEKLQRNEIPIEKLVITKSVTKSLRSYKGIQPHIEVVKKMRKRDLSTAPGVGDRVGFVIVQGLQLVSNRAEDPKYVKKHGLKIDSKYYIENQLLPPMERLFEVLGISKLELVGAGKQLSLADALRNNKSEKPIVLKNIDGFICDRCNRQFKRPPLIGKCAECGGEILFYSGNKKSRYFEP